MQLFRGVAVSSTFEDLKEHRAALIRAIEAEDLKPVAMENDSAKPGVNVIESSLEMIEKASAYIGVISRKYGQAPKSPKQNPDNLSITELEFNKAVELDLPILLFLMSENHPVREADIELDPEKREKLNAFRERAKQMGPDLQVHRVYATFDTLEDFKGKAIRAVAGLGRLLAEQGKTASAVEPAPHAPSERDPIPASPAFYAEPPYIGSHEFIGRRAELERLTDWSTAADPHPVLLFEAIGGSGKSMLTWEWTTKHAAQLRADWAGRFWYSFYERGAVMADFCRRALAYITGQPLDAFKKKKTPELAQRLLHHLQARPWLIVLDGLERVLVAYHRFDAAQIADEEANRPTDQIADRDPCAAIRPEDDELLRSLAAAAPSKLLVTSRLIPRVLLNPAGQPIPGVVRISLPGLRPPDAELLLRSCGVRGGSQAIQDYLKTHCDCHPLVTGILGGLINNYLPDRSNFDAWSTDAAAGGRLNLANLDLIQKRNHILKAAIEALSQHSRELLSTLALVPESVDYAALAALSEDLSPQEFSSAVRDLERRGLLQYDPQTRRYDLHPVVRAIAAGGLKPEQTESYGQRVVDYFSEQAHRPYDEAETLDDVRNGLHVVRTLLRMGDLDHAFDAYRGQLAQALYLNLEADAETLSILRPFFPRGWAIAPKDLKRSAGAYLLNEAAGALQNSGLLEQASAAYSAALLGYLAGTPPSWIGTRTILSNMGRSLFGENRLAEQDRCLRFGIDVATLTGDSESIFCTRLDRFHQLAMFGEWEEAQATWDLLDSMGRAWSRAAYRAGEAEYYFALYRFWQGALEDEHLVRAEQLSKEVKNRIAVRGLHGLRGEWRLSRREWALAAESLHEAVSMAHAVGQTDPRAQTELALARFHLEKLANPRHEAEQLANGRFVANLELAELWLAIGDRERARKHALAAYRWSWADGEPYVFRYNLNKARALLEQLGAEIPDLQPYDPAKATKFPWEDQLIAALEKLRAEKKPQRKTSG
ncbi:MAG: DUF4062 domain-containing protein [Acidobacteriaceae bacterium]|nr:DUF4062 domain-containing protein [Acidobacteriaceae bacterium]